ncbi:MAG: hypothetical protein RLQ12_20920, partial [Cyclobacteriaceae bacterium]
VLGFSICLTTSGIILILFKQKTNDPANIKGNLIEVGFNPINKTVSPPSIVVDSKTRMTMIIE